VGQKPGRSGGREDALNSGSRGGRWGNTPHFGGRCSLSCYRQRSVSRGSLSCVILSSRAPQVQAHRRRAVCLDALESLPRAGLSFGLEDLSGDDAGSASGPPILARCLRAMQLPDGVRGAGTYGPQKLRADSPYAAYPIDLIATLQRLMTRLVEEVTYCASMRPVPRHPRCANHSP
jgi:hypothetical protein